MNKPDKKSIKLEGYNGNETFINAKEINILQKGKIILEYHLLVKKNISQIDGDKCAKEIRELQKKVKEDKATPKEQFLYQTLFRYNEDLEF